MDKLSLGQALDDLALIRRAIERTTPEEMYSKPGYRSILRLNPLLQAGGIVLTVFFFCVELFSPITITGQMLASVDHEELRRVGVVSIAQALIVMVLALYSAMWGAARRSNQSVASFLSRNFIYLRNVSFLSDLFVKFSTFTFLILARQPQWAAPAFMLFIADYLFQGRFFFLPVRTSVLLGSVCLAGGVLQFAAGSPEVLWPIIAFFTASLLSLSYAKEEESAYKASQEA